MEKIQLNSKPRAEKTNLKKLRDGGTIPAVFYGHKVATTSIAVNLGEFEKVLKKAGESTIINLVTDDGKTHPVLIHEVQNHYLTSRPIHVDFYEVSMTEKLKAKVALEFTGESVAVKNLGGVLVKVLNEVEVECLPADLPHNILVDISKLQTFQDSIHVKDLQVENKVTVITPGDEIIVKVQPPRDVEAELAVTVDEKAAVEGVIAASTEKKEGEEETPEAAEPKDKEAKPKKE